MLTWHALSSLAEEVTSVTRHGQGKPFRRSSDGRWVAKVPKPGGGHWWVTDTDEAACERKLRDLRRALAKEASSSPTVRGDRLRDHVEAWFRDIAPTRYQGRTAATNLAQARLHILPMLGGHRLRDLRPSDVQRMLNAMTTKGYAAQTVRNVGNILSVVLRQAERDGLVERNVARLVDLPKRERSRLPSMSTADVRRFLDASKGEPLWPAWALAFATGMRAGEVCGLRWSDWDRVAGTLTVDGQYGAPIRTGRKVVYPRRTGKTANAARTLHLPALGAEALRLQQAQALSAVVVFATPKGHPLSPTFVSRKFRESLEAHGFPHVRLHSLRHSSAVAMLDSSGGDVVAVSKTLGHGSLAVTIDTYAKEADAARKRGAAAMDRALGVTEHSVKKGGR